MRSLAPIAAAILALSASAANAEGKTYFFLVPTTSTAEEAAEYKVTNGIFGLAQAATNFKPKDKIDFEYTDGAILEFELPVQGSVCLFNHCTWTSTIHFGNANMPKVIRPPGPPRSDKKTIMPVTSGYDETAPSGAAAVTAMGWYDFTAVRAVPLYFGPYLVGWSWGNGIITLGPIQPIDTRTGSVTLGVTTIYDPATLSLFTIIPEQIDLGNGTTQFTIRIPLPIVPGDASPEPEPDGTPPVIDVQVPTFDVPTFDMGPYSVKGFRDSPTPLVASPSSLTYATRAGGYVSKQVTITNNDRLAQSLALSIRGGGGGWLDISAGTCGPSLAPGASCTFAVGYEAACTMQSGHNSATLLISAISVPIATSYQGNKFCSY